MLRRFAPSVEKANGSLTLAVSYRDETRQGAGLGARRISLTGVYMAWFHAASAVLFRDGIREKSHSCIELYLNHYAESGDLEEEWVLMFSRMRTQRHESQSVFVRSGANRRGSPGGCRACRSVHREDTALALRDEEEGMEMITLRGCMTYIYEIYLFNNTLRLRPQRQVFPTLCR